MARRTFAVLLTCVIVATVGCDRITKQAAISRLAGSPTRSFLDDTLRLEYTENPGAFLSLGENLSPAVRGALFTFGTAFLLIGITAAAARFRWNRARVFGVALLVAGGGSNWFDRVMRGSVTDFLNVGVGPLRTGVFNVADVAILAGAALIAAYTSADNRR